MYIAKCAHVHSQITLKVAMFRLHEHIFKVLNVHVCMSEAGTKSFNVKHKTSNADR